MPMRQEQFMPANPELGDVFKPEDLFPIVDETGTIVGVDLRIRKNSFHLLFQVKFCDPSRVDLEPVFPHLLQFVE